MIIHDTQAMLDFGKEMASKHQKIMLVGDLWAGKTTFVKGFAAGLGIDPTEVHSPTYAYLHIYDNKLLHIDMYRIEEDKDMIEKAILDAILEYDYILIEWPKFEEYYRDDGDWLTIEIVKKDDEREVSLRQYSSSS